MNTGTKNSIPPPNLLDNLDEALLVVNRPRLGLLVDFDGTISRIGPTPDEATVSPACLHSLHNLAGKLALVSVVSGRSADEIREKVGLDGLTYVGSHGAEYLENGRLHVEPRAVEYRDTIKSTFEKLRVAVPETGLVWQYKDLSASVHYRLAPNPRQARVALETALDSTPSIGALEVFWGKMVLELRAPVGLDKGHVVRKLVRERTLDALVFMGDDTTDLDGLRAVRELVAGGQVAGLGIAVLDEDSQPALMESAGYSLEGVPEVEAFLNWLDSATG